MLNGRSPRWRASGARVAAAGALAACALAACEGTNALDTAAPGAFVLRIDGSRLIDDTASLRRLTIGLDACPVAADADSSATVTLPGAPRLQLRLPAGFRQVGATLPTPTMQRIDGPDGERILVERERGVVVAWGPAYATVTRTVGRGCWVAAPTRVQAQLVNFVPRTAAPTAPATVAAVVNLPTIVVPADVTVPGAVVPGATLSVAVYARTPARRAALLARIARVRVVP